MASYITKRGLPSASIISPSTIGDVTEFVDTTSDAQGVPTWKRQNGSTYVPVTAADKIAINVMLGKDAAGANPRIFRPGDYATGNTYDPTGAADSSTSFAAMVAAVNTFNDRYIVILPPGVFKIATGTLNFTSTAPGGIIGADRATTVLIPTTGTGDMIKFATGVDGLSVQNLTVFQTGSPSTAGAAINTNGAHDILIINVGFNNQFYDVNVNGGSIKINITHTVHFQTNGSATSVGVLVSNGAAGDTYVGPDCVMSNSGATRRRACVEVVQSGHFEINQCNMTGSAQGLLVDPGAGQIVSFGFINESLFDSCTVNGATLNAATATSTIKSIHSINSWYCGTVAGTGGAGFLTTGVGGGIIDGVYHANDRFLNNQTHGYQHGFGTNFELVSCAMRGNSSAGANANDGLNIAAGVSSVTVIGGKYGGTDVASAGGNQRWGIFIAVGASDKITINGPDLSGNTSGPVSNGMTGLQLNCTGFQGGILTPPASVAAQILPITTVTRAGFGVSLPANACTPGTTIEILAYVTNAATLNTTTITAKYGINNSNGDTTLVTATATGTAVVGGALVICKLFIPVVGASGKAHASISILNNGATGFSSAGDTNATSTTLATISTNTANFFGLYMAASAASVVTIQGVSYKVTQL